MKDLIKIIEINSLVISGGGAKGFLTIGAIKLLFENNIISKIKYFYGTSFGSIISLLLCLGWDCDDILKFTINFPIECIVEYNLDMLIESYGLIPKDNFEILFKKIIRYKNYDENITFKELYDKTSKELNLITYSLKNNSSNLLNHINTPDLKIWEGLYMTAALPMLLSPYEYNNDIFIDGGIVENFPINRVKPENINKMIGIYINTKINNLDKIKTKLIDKNILNSIEYSFELIKVFLNTSRYQNLQYNCINIIHDYNDVNTTDISINSAYREKLIDMGYQQTTKQLPKIINLLFNKQINEYKSEVSSKGAFKQSKLFYNEI